MSSESSFQYKLGYNYMSMQTLVELNVVLKNSCNFFWREWGVFFILHLTNKLYLNNAHDILKALQRKSWRLAN